MPSTPTVNADPAETLQTSSLNINGTEVGHWLGKEIFLLQQAVTYISDYAHNTGKSIHEHHSASQKPGTEVPCRTSQARGGEVVLRWCWMCRQGKCLARAVLLCFFISQYCVQQMDGQPVALLPYNTVGKKIRQKMEKK